MTTARAELYRQQGRQATARRRAVAYLGRSWPLYVMMLPGMVVLALFHYYPLYGLVIDFQSYNPGRGYAGSPWVGSENFEFLLSLSDYEQIFLTTHVIAFVKLVPRKL